MQPTRPPMSDWEALGLGLMPGLLELNGTYAKRTGNRFLFKHTSACQTFMYISLGVTALVTGMLLFADKRDSNRNAMRIVQNVTITTASLFGLELYKSIRRIQNYVNEHARL